MFDQDQALRILARTLINQFEFDLSIEFMLDVMAEVTPDPLRCWRDREHWFLAAVRGALAKRGLFTVFDEREMPERIAVKMHWPWESGLKIPWSKDAADCDCVFEALYGFQRSQVSRTNVKLQPIDGTARRVADVEPFTT